MQIKAELQVLDEPVRLVAATGLTGPETGLTDQTVENINSAIKKPKIGIGEFL